MNARDAELRARLLETFEIEAAEHVGALRGFLLELGGDPVPDRALELVEATFRAMHTLKGAARSVAMGETERRCQESEALLSELTHERRVPDRATVGRLERELDEIARTLPAVAAPAPGAPPRPQRDETIRLAAAKLDALLLQGEELLPLKLAAADRVTEAEQLVAELRHAGGEARARALLEALQADRRATATAVDGLLEEARRARMMPASTVLDVFPRLVRDLAAGGGKEAEFAAHGGELEIDRRILEAIKDPLIHIVRNAVDHGIEPPDERAAAGKPRRGRIAAAVTALPDGRIEIALTDDGRGIDLARVREAAVRRRLADAGALDEQRSLELLYESGFSTSFVITDVSGHGLGLAIVKERVEALNGELELESRPGRGVALRMRLPAAVATFRGLQVRAGAERFLIAVEAVERVLPAREGDDAGTPRSAVRHGGEVVPAAGLRAVLGLSPAEAGAPACVVVRGAGATAGVVVDEVLGDCEVTVKELAPPLVRVRHIAGAGLLGSGRLVLILRPADLVRTVRERPPAAPGEPAPADEPPHVLVVDDAITTRTMERGLLEAAGYRVDVAVDGRDAWEALQREDFDLVVSDVDMPRMNGFELTTRIRGDARLADVPVVLVSALESRADKEHGIDAGANAYVVKSTFDQSNLLEIIGRLGTAP
ncbi:MAG TPA: response regulator [Solirubrobacter sp.]|nr:response regulator [Solirubrobacter sp.]